MEKWKPEAGKDAVVRVTGHMLTTDGQKHAFIEGTRATIPVSALRPLPTALSAEDALRDPSDREVARAWETWTRTLGSPSDFMGAALRDFLARRRSTPPAAEAQEGAWVPKVDDRVRTKWVRDISGEPIRGVVTYNGASGDVIYKIDNGGGVGSALPSWLEPDPEPATPRDTTALRDAVVEAVSALIAKARESWPGDSINALGWGAEGRALSDAHDALLAAEAPSDPVVEALDDLKLLADQWETRGDRHSADRLRAALSALGDRERTP